MAYFPYIGTYRAASIHTSVVVYIMYAHTWYTYTYKTIYIHTYAKNNNKNPTDKTDRKRKDERWREERENCLFLYKKKRKGTSLKTFFLFKSVSPPRTEEAIDQVIKPEGVPVHGCECMGTRGGSHHS